MCSLVADCWLVVILRLWRRDYRYAQISRAEMKSFIFFSRRHEHLVAIRAMLCILGETSKLSMAGKSCLHGKMPENAHQRRAPPMPHLTTNDRRQSKHWRMVLGHLNCWLILSGDSNTRSFHCYFDSRVGHELSIPGQQIEKQKRQGRL
jgi:hypothetical protein